MKPGEYTFFLIRKAAYSQTPWILHMMMSRIPRCRVSSTLTLELSKLDVRRLWTGVMDTADVNQEMGRVVGGPIVCGLLVGPDALQSWQALMGPTHDDPAPRGTVRRGYGLHSVYGSPDDDRAWIEASWYYEHLDRMERV
jgi:hypothetical protein